MEQKVVLQQSDNELNWQVGQFFNHGSYIIRDEQGCKYILERTLGSGGFGITYLAEDESFKKVVIKTIKQEIKSHPAYIDLKSDFYNEALRLARFHHPHIVQVKKIIHVQDLPCIVMEYIEGKNLAELLSSGAQLSEEQTISYIKQVGEALIEVHSKGWLHRDIKPGNIIIRSNGLNAVLIDFGIARPFVSNINGTMTAIVTPGFAPIEQYDPNGKHGFHSDVYALSATLYYLLTGITPPSAQLRFQKQQDLLTAPKHINPNISEHVNQAILEGMERFPEQRPQTVQQWLDLLHNSNIPSTVIKKKSAQNSNNASTHIKNGNGKSLRNGLIGIGMSSLAIGAIIISKTMSHCHQEQELTICKKIADVGNVPQGKPINFADAATFPPLDKLLHPIIQKKYPQFNYYGYEPNVIPSSDTAVKWLLDNTRGDLSFVQTSQAMTDKPYELAKNQGFRLQEIPIAHNVYAVYVNRELTEEKLKGLTIEQLANIFTGKTKNWQELGGPDLKIIPVRLTKQTQNNYTSDYFQEKVMKGQPYGNNRQEILLPNEGVKFVAKTPGSISFITASQVVKFKTVPIRILPIAKDKNSAYIPPCTDNTCETLNFKQVSEKSYPRELTGDLYVVIKDDNGFHRQAGIAYTNMVLSEEGQQLVQKAGFVPR